jgi:predicted amidophosphoribosyltransferase
LVDDVLTTDATCEAAAAVLRVAGIRRVSVVVFAAA